MKTTTLLFLALTAVAGQASASSPTLEGIRQNVGRQLRCRQFIEKRQTRRGLGHVR